MIDDSKDIVKKEESKGELENKLQVLNEKKHNLVQMLKQVNFVFGFVIDMDHKVAFGSGISKNCLFQG